MSKGKRPTSAALPRSLKAPDFLKDKREREEAEEKEWAERCGPVVVRKVESTRVGEWGGD